MRVHPSLGPIYHVTPTAPYVIGCYRGEVLCSTTNNVQGCVGSPTGTAGVEDEAGCTAMGATLRPSASPDQVPWTVDASKVPTTAHCSDVYCPAEAAYSWDFANPTPLGLTSSVACTESATTSTISSNGVPDHHVAQFPMNHPGGTAGTGHGDNPNTIVAQAFSWAIPRYPKLKSSVPPQSILESNEVLPMGPIGFAVNGVPLFNPFNVNLDDAVSPLSSGYEVMDMCVGHPTGQGQYHYHSTPWCVFQETAVSIEELRRALGLSEAQCSDGVRNGDESDVDCGGTCPQRCTHGRTCDVGNDCEDGAACVSGTCLVNGKQPNIIYILVDDWGWNDFGHRSTDLPFATPVLDNLAAEGVEMLSSYVSPTCTPSRASFLTGRYPDRLGIFHPIGSLSRHGLPEDEVTVAQELKQEGYATSWFGKWHVGFSSDSAAPWGRGFDRTYGFIGAGGQDYYTKTHQYFDLVDDGTIVTNQTEAAMYSTELYAYKARTWIEEHTATNPDQPFFMYYGLQNVHEPLQFPARYHDETGCAGVADDTRGDFCALLMAADEAVGQVTNVLADLGIDDNTIVVLSSDNGGTSTYGSFNNPLRGGKGKVWEGGVRAPGVVWAPGHLPASRAGGAYDGLIHISDWLPTFLRLAGRTRSDGCETRKPLDGMDVWEALVQDKQSPRSEILHAYQPDDGSVALRSGHYKLLLNQDSRPADGWLSPDSITGPGASAQSLLFNITADPYETTNLWDTLPTIRDDILARLQILKDTIVRDTCSFTECTDPAATTKAAASGGWLPWVSAADSFFSNTECTGDYTPVQWHEIQGCADPQCGHCYTSVKDGDESDVDCGGSCTACPVGGACTVDADCETLKCTEGACAESGHSPLIGWALDGFPIYGPYTDGGVLPTDLDICNGRAHPTKGYVYHVSPSPPYVIGCYSGEVICSSVKNIDGCVTAGLLTGTSNALSCDIINGLVTSGNTAQQVSWSVNAGAVPTEDRCNVDYCPREAAYSWDTEGATTSLGAANSVVCSDPQQAAAVLVTSNGLPAETVGLFPLDHPGGTTGDGVADNANTISSQSYSWRLPRSPKLKATAPTSNIITNPGALPTGAVGFTTSGVPFHNTFEGGDRIAASSAAYTVTDLCNGFTTNQGRYMYLGTPWCLFDDTSVDRATQRLAHGLAAGQCTDGLLNGDEADVDCGGLCPARCAAGKACSVNSDCSSGACVDDACFDACASSPCNNGGACTSSAGTFSCDCSGTGFTGATCDTPTCTADYCQNGGTCSESGGSLSCDCSTSTDHLADAGTGLCTVVIDDCASTPCEVDETCVDGARSFSCVSANECPDGIPHLFVYDDGTGAPMLATDDCDAAGFTCTAETPTLPAPGGGTYYLVSPFDGAANHLARCPAA